MKSLRAFIWPSVHRAVPQPASPSGSLCCTFVRSRRVVDPRRLAVSAIHQMPHLIPGEIFSSATFPAQKSSWRASRSPTCCTRKPVLRDRSFSAFACILLISSLEGCGGSICGHHVKADPQLNAHSEDRLRIEHRSSLSSLSLRLASSLS